MKRLARFTAVCLAALTAFAITALGSITEHGHSAHSYRVTALKNGAVFFVCPDCGEGYTAAFADALGTESAALDTVSDGAVNAKDYAYLLQNAAYYTDINIAVSDAAGLTTQHADADEGTAAVQLTVDGGTAFLTLFEDISACGALSFPQNTVLNLNGKTLAFSEGAGITFLADFCALNGTLSAVNRAVVKSDAAEAHRALLRAVTLNETVTPSMPSECRVLSLKAENAVLDNVRITAEGTGNGSYNLYGIYTEPAVNAEIVSLTIEMNCNGVARLQGTELGGTATLTDLNATVLSENAGTWGVRTLQGSDTVLNGAEIYAATSGADHGLGLVLNGAATVNATEALPVHCFGKRQGISTSPYEKTAVNGGTYSSCEHIAYVTGNADFSDCVFINENREKYDGLDSAYCVYLGESRCPENAVCNFYSCRFGSENYTENAYGSVLVATNNYGYRTPRDICLYDCTLHRGTASFFNYNYPSASNPSNARFYLYGETRLCERTAAGTAVSKEALAASVESWKTKTRYNSATGKYSPQLIGDKYILGTCAKVNETTGEIEALYLTDDANIYDYR